MNLVDVVGVLVCLVVCAASTFRWQRLMDAARKRRASRRRCVFCRRPHPVSDRVAEESPFCSACLHERVAVSGRSNKRGYMVLGPRAIARDVDGTLYIDGVPNAGSDSESWRLP